MPGIIVGVDGSEHSRWALQWAMNEAVARHAALTVLNVQYPGATASPEDELNRERTAQKMRVLVDKAVSTLPGPVPPVTVRVIPGSPAAELIGAGRDADLMVVGLRGSGGSGRPGPGSVSSEVAHDAPCPVVILLQPWTAR